MTDFSPARALPSPNFIHAARGMLPNKINIYTVAYKTPEEAIERQAAVRMAMHYYIAQDGEVVQAVAEEFVPLASSPDRFEIAVCGEPTTHAQAVSLITLLRDMMKRHHIVPAYVRLSSDLAFVSDYLTTDTFPEEEEQPPTKRIKKART